MKRRINTDKYHWLLICGEIVLLCLFISPSPAQQPAPRSSVKQSSEQSGQPPKVTKLPPNARITQREVIAVQVELRRQGFLKTSISAELDPDTREAVKEYQRKNGLQVTGKIDPPTYEKLGLPYPAPDPQDSNLVQQVGGTVKEATRFGLEKSWDAGSYTASKSKEAARSSWEGVKVTGRAAQRKADSLIRRDDDDTAKDISDLFLEHREWSGVIFSVKEGMVTLKFPPKSPVDVGSVVHEIRKIAGVRSVFVIVL